MNREEKAAVIEEVAQQIQDAEAIFAVDYRGISVTQAVALRARLTEADASFRVVKNSLTERAADQAGAEDLKGFLAGPTAFTFVRQGGDAALAAKALAAFRRENQLLEFKGGRLGGDMLSVEQIESISRLPSREVLHQQFVGVLASPITGLVRGLASLISGLAIQLRQIEEQGLVTGEAPAPAAEEPPAPEEPPAAEDAPATEDAPEMESQEAAASEAPGDPVAEAAAAEEKTSESPSEGDSEAPSGDQTKETEEG